MQFSANDKQNEAERSAQNLIEPIVFNDNIEQNKTALLNVCRIYITS